MSSDKFREDLVRAFEVLRTIYGKEDIDRSLRLLTGVVKQLDGRTLGLIAYNGWNTRPAECSCRDNGKKCPCRAYVQGEKWMSIADDFSKLDLVVCVEVSDIVGIGLALEGEVFYKSWGGSDCDFLPELALNLLHQLEELNDLWD